MVPLTQPVLHANGVRELPEGWSEAMDTWEAEEASPNLPPSLRHFEALVTFKMYDPESRVHQRLRDRYLSYVQDWGGGQAMRSEGFAPTPSDDDDSASLGDDDDTVIVADDDDSAFPGGDDDDSAFPGDDDDDSAFPGDDDDSVVVVDDDDAVADDDDTADDDDSGVIDDDDDTGADDDDVGPDDDDVSSDDDDTVPEEEEACEAECYLEWNGLTSNPGEYDVEGHFDRCTPSEYSGSGGTLSSTCKDVRNANGWIPREGALWGKWEGCDKHGTVRIRCDWSGDECSGATCGVTGFDSGNYDLEGEAHAQSFYTVFGEDQHGYGHAWASVQAGHWSGGGFQDVSGRVKVKTQPAEIACNWEADPSISCEASIGTSGLSRSCNFGSLSFSCAGKKGEDDVEQSWSESITSVASEILFNYDDTNNNVASIGGRRVRGYTFVRARNEVQSTFPYFWNAYGSRAEASTVAELDIKFKQLSVVNEADEASKTTCSTKGEEGGSIHIACGEELTE